MRTYTAPHSGRFEALKDSICLCASMDCKVKGCQSLTIWFYLVNMNNKTLTTASLQSFEALGQEVPFWKPLISHSLELGFHGNGMILELKYHFQ